MKNSKRLFFGVFAVGVAVCLLPVAQFQLPHDLLEISIHGTSSFEGESVLASPSVPRAHDCHSCLASHPGASVYPAPEAATFAGPRSDGPLQLGLLGLSAFRKAESPNKRSPPA